MLGNLAPQEEAAFAALLESNPDLRRELAELADLPELLHLAGQVDGDGGRRCGRAAPAPLPYSPDRPGCVGSPGRGGAASARPALRARSARCGSGRPPHWWSVSPAAVVASRSGSDGPAGPVIEQELALGPGKAPIEGAGGTVELFTEGNGVGCGSN